MTIAWRHVVAGGNDNGVAWVQSANDPGTHAKAIGGYVDSTSWMNTPDPEVDGTSAGILFPVVGTYPLYVPSTDTTYWHIGFAMPPGMAFGCHVWWET